jgi:transcriptional regulator with XRE-family HTH domain
LVSRACDETENTSRARAYEATPERFGRHVQALRRSRGLTQEQLAERSDLSTDAIRRIERGRLSPSLVTIAKLGRGLELSVSTIFAGIEQRTRPLALELAEYVSSRTPRERELAWRVLRALFDDTE